MKGLRVAMAILASLHLGWSALVALGASFADGGSVPERLLLSAVHPLAAILLLYVVVSSERITPLIWRTTVALLSVGIVGDILAAVLIGQGTLRGDWPLPLTFTVVPVIGLVYIVRRRHGRQAVDR
ncbi:MAG: hypothetical protein OXM57_08675 [bacterium]|nr:hypothetical protein [bacterium]MDE0352753.1 hypothetical protein [bacterium]